MERTKGHVKRKDHSRAGDEFAARSGRYIAQPTGYRTFIPEPLPPKPPIQITGELQRLLSEADRALGRLDGYVLTLHNPDLFAFMYVRKEGGSLQPDRRHPELPSRPAEADILGESLPRDVDEVVN